jgi:hypothetical protein
MTDDLQLTRSSITRDLYDCMRSKYPTVRVRIFNNSFTGQARHIVRERAHELPENEDESYKRSLRQIQERFVFYEIQLPLFWTTLADCISSLCDLGFGDIGKNNMEAVQILAQSIDNTVTIALYALSRRIRKSIPSSSAKKFGSEGFAEWLAKSEQFEYRFGNEYFTLHEIIAKIVEPSLVEKLEELHLIGNKEKRDGCACDRSASRRQSYRDNDGGTTPGPRIPARHPVLALPPTSNTSRPHRVSVRSREAYSRIE